MAELSKILRDFLGIEETLTAFPAIRSPTCPDGGVWPIAADSSADMLSTTGYRIVPKEQCLNSEFDSL